MKKLIFLYLSIVSFISIDAQQINRVPADSILQIETDSSICFYKIGETIPFNGIEYTQYLNGEINTETNYVDGLPNGDYFVYYINGNIKNQGVINSDFLENGLFFEWYESGLIKISGYYTKGKKDKTWFYYSNDPDNFKVIKVLRYNNGTLIGDLE